MCVLPQAERALSKFACQLCKAIMEAPVCTPCGHYFCKPCLASKHAPAADAAAAAAAASARTFRTRKTPKPCPKCNANLHGFIQTMQINQALASEIAQNQGKVAEAATRHAEALAAAAAAAPRYEDAPADTELPVDADSAAGWHVSVWWPEEAQWFRGIVEKSLPGGKVAIRYADGDYQEHAFAEEQFKWLVELPPAAEAAANADAVAGAAAGADSGGAGVPEAAAAAAAEAAAAAVDAADAQAIAEEAPAEAAGASTVSPCCAGTLRGPAPVHCAKPHARMMLCESGGPQEGLAHRHTSLLAPWYSRSCCP